MPICSIEHCDRDVRKMNEQIKQGNVLELWAPKYPEVNTQWLPHLQIKAKYAYYFYLFCQWADKTPPELLALKNNPSSKEAEKLLNTFTASSLQMTNAVKFLTVQAVRSFFKWNMCDLARIAGQIILEKQKPYHKLRKEDLRKLWNNTYNPRDRALITFVCSTAIAKETLCHIQWGHLEEDWEAVSEPCINLPAQLLKGHGIGKYHNVRQITFLTPEAKRDLINYKEWLERQMGRKVHMEDNIFCATYAPYNAETYASLGYVVWQLSRRAGVPFSWHDARRWVNTASEQIGLVPNWARKIRGRLVRGEEAPYSQPAIDQLREKFREAVPLLEFTSEAPTVSKETLREEVMKALEEEKLKDIASKYHVPIEQVRTALRSKAKNWESLLKHTTDDCSNGEHCQCIVSEQELPKLLAEGFHVAAVLPSGKIVVET